MKKRITIVLVNGSTSTYNDAELRFSNGLMIVVHNGAEHFYPVTNVLRASVEAM